MIREREIDSGHGVSARRGRFLSGDAVAADPDSGLLAAMERLLELGDARATLHFTPRHCARLHHIEAGAGPALVLIHGACGGSANWYRLIKRLSGIRRVIALDLPGFGFSESIDFKSPLGHFVAQTVLDWLDEIGIGEFDAGGTSFGSLVALRLAQAAPRRVSRIALINGVGLGRELPLALRVALLQPFSTMAMRPSRFGTRWQFNELMTSERTRLPAAHVDALLEYLWQSASAHDHRRLAAAFNQFGGFAGQREIFTDEELAGIRQRLLILWGARDRFLPVEHGQRAAALVPCALLRIIPDSGHSPNWEAPEAVLECLVPFLTGLNGVN